MQNGRRRVPLARTLSALTGRDRIVAQSERSLAETFVTDAVVFLPEDGSLQPIVDHRISWAADASEVAVAQWVLDRGRTAGRGTDTLPSAKALNIPLATANGIVGVLAVRHNDPDRLLMPETRRLLEASAAQVALALERDRLVEQADRSCRCGSRAASRYSALGGLTRSWTPLAQLPVSVEPA